MAKTILVLWISFLFLTIWCCKNETLTPPVLTTSGTIFSFLDRASAAVLISQDTMESFFDVIMPLDMAIQMKQAQASTQRDSLLPSYKTYLQNDVDSFTTKEKKLLLQALQQAHELLASVHAPNIPDTIQLIKTQGKHYGPTAYYTRMNAIIIPKQELVNPSIETLTRIMLHEYFHIYSRYHPEKRDSLYGLIGFMPADKPAYLPSPLQERILLNPDGINWKYHIQLTIDSQNYKAVPLLVSTKDRFTVLTPSFFSYLDFQLYPLEDRDSIYEVRTAIDGIKTPLPPPNEITDFFRQIGDNTNYIIHPDEVLADNFVLLLFAQTEEASFQINQYSERGQEILLKMKDILME